MATSLDLGWGSPQPVLPTVSSERSRRVVSQRNVEMLLSISEERGKSKNGLLHCSLLGCASESPAGLHPYMFCCERCGVGPKMGKFPVGTAAGLGADLENHRLDLFILPSVSSHLILPCKGTCAHPGPSEWGCTHLCYVKAF